MANNQFYKGNNFKQKDNRNFTKVNFYIKSPSVRVVKDGQQLGVFQIDAARKLALDAGLDLVEIVPNANPPVCSICDYDKYRYEQKQKEKEASKKQKKIETKEVRMRPCTQENDIKMKANMIRRFLAEGKKVLVNLEYKRREMRPPNHRDEGFKIVNSVIDQIKDVATIEQMPKMEGTRLTCRVAPKAEVVAKVN